MLYDKFAKYYDATFEPFEPHFLSKWRAETLALLPENAAILELGAGTGANFPLYPRSKQAVSTELSCKMLDIARSKAKSNILIQADAQQLPFDASSFDAAFATLVFCSIPRPEDAFAELMRVTKPNGTIVLLEHVRPPGALGYAFDLLNMLTAALIEDHFNRRTAEIAEKCGLIPMEIRIKAAGAVNLIVCKVVK